MPDYCKLPKGAIVKYGSGGSKAIIAITSDAAYKYFPMFKNLYDNKKQVIYYAQKIKYEISVCKELTELFVKTNKTPYIVQYLNCYKCDKIPKTLFNICDSYTDFIMKKNKASVHCNYLYKNYPIELIKPMFILKMEKADSSLESMIENLSKKKIDEIYEFLDRLLFQIFFTLETIKLKFPRYAHNDLFIRNILVKNTDKIYKQNQYIRHYYKDKIFDVPAPGLFIKINDMERNQLNLNFFKKNNINSTCPLNPYRDYFSILYDLYDGANLGGKSFHSIIKNKEKWHKIEKYFSKFIDVKNIKKIIKNNKKHTLDKDWAKTFDPEVVKLFGMPQIKKYLEYFEDVFCYNETHYIVEEYGK